MQHLREHSSNSQHSHTRPAMSQSAVRQSSLASQDSASLAIVTTDAGQAEFDGADAAGVELSESLSTSSSSVQKGRHSRAGSTRSARSARGDDSPLPDIPDDRQLSSNDSLRDTGSMIGKIG